ncbi:MAG: Dam family site-specific DNA-(adenine-N6)-methyltransferase [Mycoplasma sp.]
MKNNYIKPAFNHLGNKYRMLEELFNYFPKENVDNFFDVFSGSGVVSNNFVLSQNHYLNDYDTNLFNILKLLFKTPREDILKQVETIVDKYNLPREKREYSREYKQLKNDYNKEPNIYKLLVLILFGFNQQIRFNKNGEFNIPTGKFWWNDYHKEKLSNFIDHANNKQTIITNQDFSLFVKNNINKTNPFFYFDPPYLLSNATYNNVWNNDMENKLIEVLQLLTDKKIKWVLSNVLESKGETNHILKGFVERNNLKINIIEKVSYSNSSYHRKTTIKPDVEVIITNIKK